MFLVLYTIEMVIKITGMGFFWARDSYLRDPWNQLDFVIVMSGYLLMYLNLDEGDGQIYRAEVGDLDAASTSFNLSGLRVFRVLRPLKTVQNIKGLKVLMTALFGAVGLLADTMLVLMFFFFIYSIVGTQLLCGELKKRCIEIESGRRHEDDIICGAQHCPEGYFCGKTNENPNYGATNFDNVFFAFLVVF